MNRSGFAWEKLLDAAIASNVEAALAEDVGPGDLTASLLPPDELVSGRSHRPRKGRPVRYPVV